MNQQEIFFNISEILKSEHPRKEQMAGKIYAKATGKSLPDNTMRARFAFIAISNVCNLQCPMCEGPKHAGYKPVFMSFDLFKRAVAECLSLGIFSIALHNVNEPILHKNIVDFLFYAEDVGMGCFVSTNGQLLHKFIDKMEKNERKLKSLHLRYSIEGGSKDEYEVCRYPGKFDKLIVNVKRIKEYCAEKGIKLTTGVQYALHKQSISHLASFYSIFSPYITIDPMKSFSFMGSTWSPDQNGFIQENSLLAMKIRERCTMFDSALSILPNGKVSYCCGDREMNRTIVGDIAKEPLHCITSSLHYSLLHQHASDLYCGLFPVLCQECKEGEITGEKKRSIFKMLSEYFGVMDSKSFLSERDLDYLDRKIKKELLAHLDSAE